MISDTIFLAVELIVLFYTVSFGMELIQRRLGPDRLRVWMCGKPTTAALKGIAIGFVTPFCTYPAIPGSSTRSPTRCRPCSDRPNQHVAADSRPGR